MSVTLTVCQVEPEVCFWPLADFGGRPPKDDQCV